MELGIYVIYFRLMNLLRNRLAETGWNDALYAECRGMFTYYQVFTCCHDYYYRKTE